MVCCGIASIAAWFVVLLAPAWLLGLIPLRGSAPLFMVAFLSGAVLERVWSGRGRGRGRRPKNDLRLP